MKKEIPIFFSTDDNYIPYLDIAISSLMENASNEYEYRIIVLNTGLKADNVNKVKKREKTGFKIDFIDISKQLGNIISRFKNVYHFSIAAYYRLFIASLFPEYDKVLYLDADIVVLGDISKLYETELGDNILAAVPDQYVKITEEFKNYTKNAIGVEPENYISSGVLVINLGEFRRNGIEEKFTHLLGEYDFDLLDPDQAYLNYLCRGKILFLPNGWNKVPLPTPSEGEKNIVHFALYKKPWEYDDVIDGECFWDYAKRSPFYDEIIMRKTNFSEEQKRKKEAVAGEILEHALAVVASGNTFSGKLSGEL